MPPKKVAAVKKAGKAPKAKKEREGPKRPLSAYFCFAKKRRPQLIAEKPALQSNVREVAKILGNEWKALSDGQKAPYLKQSEEEKKRYEAEKAKQK